MKSIHVLPVLTLVVVVLLWQAGVMISGVQPFLVPSPAEVATEAFAGRELLGAASGVTVMGALSGFGLSAFLGTCFAFLLTRARWIEWSLVPYAIFMQTVPIVALAPLLVLWFGPGFKSVAASSFLVSVFPVIASATTGLRSVDPEHRNLFKLYAATPWQRFWKLEAPSAVPYWLAGLRSASGLAVIGAVVGEFVAGQSGESPGLGNVIMGAYRQIQTPRLFAAIFCCSAMGLLMYGAVSWIGQRWLSRWHASSG